METAQLTLKSLHLLSPGLADDFSEQMTAAVLDCKQRPSLAEKRTVTVKLTITPHPEDPEDEPCAKCGGLGYFGRVAMFEMLEMTEGMREIVLQAAAPATA